MRQSVRRFVITCLLTVILVPYESVHTLADRVRILNVQTTTASGYIDLNATIHSNATRFDLLVVVHRIMPNHDLYFSLKLRVRPKSRRSFSTVYSLQRMPVCDFLRYADNHKVLNFIFKTSLPETFALRCPIKTGEFLLENLSINNTCMAKARLDGQYQMYAEVVQLHEGVLKLLSLQITAEYTVESRTIATAKIHSTTTPATTVRSK